MGGRRFPLHSEHNMSLPTAGFIENVRLEPDPDESGEWQLIGDIACEGSAADALGGFSISGVEKIRESPTADASIYLSFPHYNDLDLLQHFSGDSHLTVGKWIKKGANEIEWGILFGSLIAFAITPIWDDLYKRKIAPRIDELLAHYISNKKLSSLPAELIQVIIFRNADVEVRLIPTRGRELHCFRCEAVVQGLKLVVDRMKSDPKANDVGLHRVVIFFDDLQDDYSLH